MLVKRRDSLALHVVANILNFVLEHLSQSVAIIVNIVFNVLGIISIGHNRDNGRNKALPSICEPSIKNLSLCNDVCLLISSLYIIINLLKQFASNLISLYCSCLQLPNNLFLIQTTIIVESKCNKYTKYITNLM